MGHTMVTQMLLEAKADTELHDKQRAPGPETARADSPDSPPPKPKFGAAHRPQCIAPGAEREQERGAALGV